MVLKDRTTEISSENTLQSVECPCNTNSLQNHLAILSLFAKPHVAYCISRQMTLGGSKPSIYSFGIDFLETYPIILLISSSAASDYGIGRAYLHFCSQHCTVKYLWSKLNFSALPSVAMVLEVLALSSSWLYQAHCQQRKPSQKFEEISRIVISLCVLFGDRNLCF